MSSSQNNEPLVPKDWPDDAQYKINKLEYQLQTLRRFLKAVVVQSDGTLIVEAESILNGKSAELDIQLIEDSSVKIQLKERINCG